METKREAQKSGSRLSEAGWSSVQKIILKVHLVFLASIRHERGEHAGNFASELLAYSSYGVPWIVRTYLNSTQRGTVGLMNFFLGVTCMHDISLFFKGDNFSFFLSSCNRKTNKPISIAISSFRPERSEGSTEVALMGTGCDDTCQGMRKNKPGIGRCFFSFLGPLCGFLGFSSSVRSATRRRKKRQSPIENTLKPPAKKAQSCLFGR